MGERASLMANPKQHNDHELLHCSIILLTALKTNVQQQDDSRIGLSGQTKQNQSQFRTTG